MKSEVMQYFHMPYLSLIGLLIFFSFFMLMLLFVMQRKRSGLYTYLGHLPLGEDEA
jgi:hypothetical protein